MPTAHLNSLQQFTCPSKKEAPLKNTRIRKLSVCSNLTREVSKLLKAHSGVNTKPPWYLPKKRYKRNNIDNKFRSRCYHSSSTTSLNTYLSRKQELRWKIYTTNLPTLMISTLNNTSKTLKKFLLREKHRLWCFIKITCKNPTCEKL